MLDEPLTGNPDPNNYGYTDKIYTKDQPRTYEIVKGWRGVLNEYPDKRIMMMEAYSNMTMTIKYYVYGAHFPFNFGLISNLNRDSKANDFKNLIDGWMMNMPTVRGTANWVVSRARETFGSFKSNVKSRVFFLKRGVRHALSYITRILHFIFKINDKLNR